MQKEKILKALNNFRMKYFISNPESLINIADLDKMISDIETLLQDESQI